MLKNYSGVSKTYVDLTLDYMLARSSSNYHVAFET